MKRIGIYGGSFDPIHIGHLLIAEQARDLLKLDTIYFMPARLSPLKQGTTATEVSDRFAMVELAVQGNPGFAVSDLELKRQPPSYTIDTVKILRQEHPDCRIYLLIGADSLLTLEDWMTFEELMKEVVFVVAGRPGLDPEATRAEAKRLEEDYGAQMILLNTPLLDISSTWIRNQCAKGLSIRYAVTPAVEAYIKRHTLYENQGHR